MKTLNPIELKYFQLIRLCNVVYKVVSKILANRLRPFLGENILENQSAFVSVEGEYIQCTVGL